MLFLGCDFEVALVVRVKEQTDFTHFSVKTVFLYLQDSVVWQVVLLQDHYRVGLLGDLGGTEDRAYIEIIVVFYFLRMDDQGYVHFAISR